MYSKQLTYHPDSVLQECFKTPKLRCTEFHQADSLSFVENSVYELDKVHDLIKGCDLTSKSDLNKRAKKGPSKMSTTSLSGGVFRPRGALARSLYEKHQNDCKLRQLDKEEVSVKSIFLYS